MADDSGIRQRQLEGTRLLLAKFGHNSAAFRHIRTGAEASAAVANHRSGGAGRLRSAVSQARAKREVESFGRLPGVTPHGASHYSPQRSTRVEGGW